MLSFLLIKGQFEATSKGSGRSFKRRRVVLECVRCHAFFSVRARLAHRLNHVASGTGLSCQ